MLDTWWMKSFRWLFALVSVGAIVIAAFLFGQWLVVQSTSDCGAANMIAGSCVETWHTQSVETSIYTAVILGAIGLSLVPAWIAPALKRSFAVFILVLFAGFALTAYVMLGWADLAMPLFVGILVMIVGTLITLRIHRVV